MSLIETGEEVKFARSLVNPDKSLRDQTLLSLQKYASALQRIDDLEMLKLWKGLYYCMWLSDKQEIQFELATSLANLIDKFRSPTIVYQYIRLFYRTILREWFSLDQYRVNKFYTLIRLFLNRSLNYAYKSKWSSEVTNEILLILKEEVLAKKPNGIRFHIADIFIHELWSVTEGSITVKNFMTLIQPFIDVFIVGANDTVFIERVQQSVFVNFLEAHAGQNEDVTADAEEKGPTELFSSDITLAVQKQLFDLASEENTSESARKRLYALHKRYQTVSGVPFVSEEDIKNAKKTTGRPVSRPVEGLKVAASAAGAVESTSTTGAVDGKQKSSKKKRSNSETVETSAVPVVTAAATSESVVSSGKATKKAKTEESSKSEVTKDQEDIPKAKKGKVVSAGDESAKKKSVTEADEPVKSSKDKQSKTSEPAVEETEPKAKKPKSILSTSSSSVEPSAAAEPEFVASKKFAGAKPGYVFHNGKSGLGYYKDNYVRPEKKVVSFQQKQGGNNKKGRK